MVKASYLTYNSMNISKIRFFLSNCFRCYNFLQIFKSFRKKNLESRSLWDYFLQIKNNQSANQFALRVILACKNDPNQIIIGKSKYLNFKNLLYWLQTTRFCPSPYTYACTWTENQTKHDTVGMAKCQVVMWMCENLPFSN